MLRRAFVQEVVWTGNGARFAAAVLIVWTTAVEPMLAQTSVPSRPTPKARADLGSSKNAQYETRASGGLLAPRGRRCTITLLSS